MRFLAIAVACCALTYSQGCEYSSFDDYMQQYSKSYGAAEREEREANWKQAVAEVQAHNAKGLSWTAGLNEYADLSWTEFQQRMLMAPQQCSVTRTSTGWAAPAGVLLPSSIDWRAKGALNAIKVSVARDAYAVCCVPVTLLLI